ncbi:PLC-like phosphodiesterase [Mariannaea sp. PMI_226]|nr:PLC-like phosphodiesterase [Mariannaea sp. PMI_226]
MTTQKSHCVSLRQLALLAGISVGVVSGLPPPKAPVSTPRPTPTSLSKTQQAPESTPLPGNWPFIGPHIPDAIEPGIVLKGNKKESKTADEHTFWLDQGKEGRKHHEVPQENPMLGRTRVTKPEESAMTTSVPHKFLMKEKDRMKTSQTMSEIRAQRPEHTYKLDEVDTADNELHTVSQPKLVRRTSESSHPPNNPNYTDTELIGLSEPMRDKKGKYLYVDDWTTVIDVINATPYRWRKGSINAYQMANWKEDWPQYISPGGTFRTVSFQRGGDWKPDSAADVTYHLEGVSKPMSFLLERRSGKKRQVYVTFSQDLRTNCSTIKNSEKIRTYNLGYHAYPGGSQFVLAGKEGEFISMDSGTQWMQELFPYIKDIPLRDLILPRSHHVGMWKASEGIGAASKANTLTQINPTAQQINLYGVRVLDIRPVLFEGKYYAAHGSKVMGAWNGMLGEDIKQIAKAIGEFHKKYPGELIIVDLSAEHSGRLEYGMQPMAEADRRELYKLFIRYSNVKKLPEHEDVTRWPLGYFIGGKTSATIIRVDDEWAKMPEFPGPEYGFVTSETFPLVHRWSDANKANKLAPDQIDHIRKERPKRGSTLFWSDWIVTQSQDEAIFPANSIVKMALPAHSALYHDLWNVTTDETYPNWIAADNIQSTALVSFVKTLNHCMAARRCGSLGGKVRVNDDQIMNKADEEKKKEKDKGKDKELKEKKKE